MVSTSDSVEREDAVVIGGGAVGVCCAHALARAGRSVLLLEGDELCAGSSWGNSGLVTTSACAPEAAPGIIAQAARWMLDRNGPFRFRPRPDPGLLRWLLRFRRYCTAVAAHRSTLFLRDRIRENLHLVQALARESPRDFAFRSNGLLVLYATEAGIAEGRASAAALAEIGIPSQELDARAVAEREPSVTDAVVGGILYPEDAHMDPGEFVAATADLARRYGARIVEGEPALRLHGSRRVETIETSARLIRPELVVLANGAWAGRLARSIGLRLLIEPAKGFSLTYPADSEIFARPLRLWEARTVVSSMASNVRVTSKLDLVGLDTRVRERRARRSAADAARYVFLPPGVEQARTWAGLRPLTPDGLPLIGRSPNVDNLVVAAGHGHLGISLGAVTGEAVAAIATGDGPGFDLVPVRPDRFLA
jgi:D-amino-acid dehydrogenase